MRSWVMWIVLVACDQGAKSKPTPTPALAAACAPATTWTPLATTNAPPATDRAIAHWIGKRLAVFTEVDGLVRGALFDPCTNRWTTIPQGPKKFREQPTIAGPYVVWPFADDNLVSAYDTDQGTWRDIALTAPVTSLREGMTSVWTGTELILWGGRGPDYMPRPGGVRIDLARGSVRAMTSAGEPSLRIGANGAWLANRAIIWGGCATNPQDGCMPNGATYDPATDRWTPIASTNQPTTGDMIGTAANRAVVYSPEGGAVYDPVANQWTPVAKTEPHSDWRLHGDYLVVSGQGTTLVYSITRGTWASVPTPPPPDRFDDLREDMLGVTTRDVRVAHVDAAAEMWLLDPAVPRWNHVALPKLGVDGLRATVTAWTGSRMILWSVLRRIPAGNGCEGVVGRACDPVSLFRQEATPVHAMLDVRF